MDEKPPEVTDAPGAAVRPGSDEAAYLALHAERQALERSLSLAQARQRFSADVIQAAAARAEEADLLKALDRVLTMIRAAEYKRRPGARRW